MPRLNAEIKFNRVSKLYKILEPHNYNGINPIFRRDYNRSMYTNTLHTELMPLSRPVETL